MIQFGHNQPQSILSLPSTGWSGWVWGIEDNHQKDGHASYGWKKSRGEREREKRKSTIIVLDPIWYYFIGCLMGYLLFYDSFICETLYVQLI